jgi:hypothetical protein
MALLTLIRAGRRYAILGRQLRVMFFLAWKRRIVLDEPHLSQCLIFVFKI